MIVREIYARLGIKVDKPSVSQASTLFTELRSKIGLIQDAFGVAKGVVRELIGETVGYAAQVKKTALLTGMTRTQVQELAEAADEAGVEFGTFQDAMLRLSRQGVKDVYKKTMDLVDSFERIKDPAARSAMAFKLFGKSGQQLIPFLSMGRKAVEESIVEHKELGVIMGEDDVQSALSLKKSMKELGSVVEGVRRTVSIPFIKAVLKVTKAMQGWMDENRTEVMAALKDGVEKLIWVIRAFLNVGAAACRVVYQLSDMFGSATLAVAALAAAIFLAGDSTTMLTLKWLAVAAVIALVTEDFLGFLNGEKSLIGDISKALDDYWDNWSPEAAARKLGDLEKHPILNFLRQVFWMVTHINEAIDTAISYWTGDSILGAVLDIGGFSRQRAQAKAQGVANKGWAAHPEHYARQALEMGWSAQDVGKALVGAGLSGERAAELVLRQQRALKASQFGLTSPSAPSARAIDAGTGVSPVTPVYAPKVEVNVAAKTNADPKEIGDQIAACVRGEMDACWREARSQLVPSPQES